MSLKFTLDRTLLSLQQKIGKYKDNIISYNSAYIRDRSSSEEYFITHGVIKVTQFNDVTKIYP